MAPAVACLSTSAPIASPSGAALPRHTILTISRNTRTVRSSADPSRLRLPHRLSSRPHVALLRVRAADQPQLESEAAAPDPTPPSSSSSSSPSSANSTLPPKHSLLEALDFSAVRSEDDALLLEDARSVTSMGEKMSREQYAALRRKVGGTYRDFFKDYIEVDGEFVDEGWVDKSCRFCKKDTASEPRTVDNYGRYAHVACLEKSKSGNFFTRLFGM